MPRFTICPWRLKSASARNLKEALAAALGYTPEIVDQDHYLVSNEWLINWGSGNFRGLKKTGATGTKIFNPAAKICQCVNKVDFLSAMEDAGVSTPAWTDSQREALRWLKQGNTVYCRTNTEGKDGDGIVVATKPSEMAAARLFTRGFQATEEYRAHVFRDEIIFELEKVHNKPTKENQLVRSGSNGWNYHRDITIPKVARQEILKAAKVLEMDFCAIDLLHSTKTGETVILEANSAPELGPWTSKAYAKKFVALI